VRAKWTWVVYKYIVKKILHVKGNIDNKRGKMRVCTVVSRNKKHLVDLYRHILDVRLDE